MNPVKSIIILLEIIGTMKIGFEKEPPRLNCQGNGHVALVM